MVAFSNLSYFVASPPIRYTKFHQSFWSTPPRPALVGEWISKKSIIHCSLGAPFCWFIFLYSFRGECPDTLSVPSLVAPQVCGVPHLTSDFPWLHPGGLLKFWAPNTMIGYFYFIGVSCSAFLWIVWCLNAEYTCSNMGLFINFFFKMNSCIEWFGTNFFLIFW